MPSSRRPSRRSLALVQESALQRQLGQSSALTQLLENNSRRLTRRQRRLSDEVYTRAGVVHGTTLLHEHGNQTIGHMHRQTQLTYLHTVQHLNAVKHSASLDEETRRDVEDWTAAQKELLRRHLSSGLDGAVTRVLEMMTKELYEDEHEPKGFLTRLFGG